MTPVVGPVIRSLSPGLKVLAAQSDTNNRPYESIALMVSKMRDNEIGGTVTVGQVMDLLQDPKNEAIQELRGKEIGRVFTLGELKEMLDQSATFEAFVYPSTWNGKETWIVQGMKTTWK